MPAKSLEDRLTGELEMVKIGAAVQLDGIDASTPVERLTWIVAVAESALDLARKIEKRDAAKARKAKAERTWPTADEMRAEGINPDTGLAYDQAELPDDAHWAHEMADEQEVEV